MAIFIVRTLQDGVIVEDEIDAKDVADARAIRARDAVVLSVRGKRGIARRKRTPKFALSLFLQELSTLLDAGLVLIEAIEALREKANDSAAAEILGKVLATMYEGQPFSKALAAQPLVFPPLLVATVESSEGSGQLPVALQRFQHYEVRLEQIKKRVTGALVYPCVVLTVGAVIMLFMAFMVIPRFSAVFETMQQLPPAARAMLAWSDIVKAHGTMLLSGLAVGLVVTVLALRTAAARSALLRAMWRLPKLKDVCHLFVLARFYRTVGLLLLGGTPLVDALGLAGKILPADYAGRLALALEQLRAGCTASTVLAAHGLTTSVAERLLRVGEQSGDLGGMCERIAHFHDGALDRAIEMFSKIFEPVLMLCVGGMVGTIVVLLYMPIFELAGSVQ
ncbi:type II secretion system protein [Burkholderia ubonensis]|uniref:General secretion pathway protein F n=1 Tax=Burkholderia ubonensis TaxID=101571 RepID=A0AAW3MK87_9BURK|nr:type II secretion system F family protein [Burkholderia ubonensis]KVN83142.1 type II secretion system protein [Burkholderia ubonensis]KVP89355.1 type II secretion system protein [Burkholderia ubonensis]KWD49510.1 type II secretion system protein [Burkholderia ubonensis]KWD67940.1 type II secretion system protein [Burkholderia ubonensis]